MTKALCILCLLSTVFFISPSLAADSHGGAQPAPSSGGNANGNQSGGGGPQLQGLSYAAATWPDELKQQPSNDDGSLVILCYTLYRTASTQQPFTLQETKIKIPCDPQDATCTSPKNPCTTINKDNPLKMNQRIAIAINSDASSLKRLKLLNINITDQQGTSQNPNPIRPSFGTSAQSPTSTAGKSQASEIKIPTTGVYYLTWPNELQGDTKYTVSINAIYTPVSQGAHLEPDTYYPPGSIISANNGHFYTTDLGGSTSSSASEPDFPPSTPPTFSDGDIIWLDSGALVPSIPGVPPPTLWRPETKVDLGNSILDVYNGHYYTVVGFNGSEHKTGPRPKDPFPILPDLADPHALIYDHNLTWQECTNEVLPIDRARIPSWSEGSAYKTGRIVSNVARTRLYKVISADGTAGLPPAQPNFPTAPVAESPAGAIPKWRDLGTTVPSSLAGGQTQDVVVNLLTFTFPQAHPLFSYNLAAGVAASNLHTPNFVNGNNGPRRLDGPRIVDPLLLLTIYLPAIDAESPVKLPHDLWPPGVVLGLSLTSPSSTFYLGGASELMRNVQVVYGVIFSKLPALSPIQSSQPTIGMAANTVQRFREGVFLGATFNFNGFVQSLFSSSKGGS